MKTMLKTSVLATSLVMALTACSEKKNNSEDKIRIQATAAMKSEELAEAGEQLVSPYTFMLSDKVFDMALEKDPNNKKAQFYKNFVKRFMVLKGVAKRIAPLVKKGTPEQVADYQKWQREFPESPLKNFLLDGTEDITSSSQLADILHDYNLALNDFRKFLKMNAGMELTLNLNPHIFEKEINESLVNSCVTVGDQETGVNVECSTSGIAQKQMNSADLIALRQLTGGEMLYWSILTAYDYSVLEKISNDPKYTEMTPPQQAAYLNSLPSVAKLRKDHTLSLIPELGSDFSAAIKWARKYHANICPMGQDTRNQRRGFLFKDGICVPVTNESEKNLALLDQALGGVFSMPVKNEQGETVREVRVNVVGFLKNPPKELKDLMPESVDQEGKTLKLKDPTVGGLFPDGYPLDLQSSK